MPPVNVSADPGEGMPPPRWLALLRRCSLALSDRRPLSLFSEVLRRQAARRSSRVYVISDFRGSARFSCDLSEHMSSHIFWRGSYSGAQLLMLENQLTRQSVFVDVGANRGEFSVAAALRVVEGQVLSFEPHPQMYNCLLRNLELNNFTNVRALRLGLSDLASSAQLFESDRRSADGSWNSGLGTIFPMEARSTGVGKVELRTLDELRDELALHRLDVIKIDVEGSELAVLKGAADTVAECRPVIMLEHNEETCRAAGYSAADLVSWLQGQNYEIRLIDRKLQLPRVEVPPEFCNIACFPR